MLPTGELPVLPPYVHHPSLHSLIYHGKDHCTTSHPPNPRYKTPTSPLTYRTMGDCDIKVWERHNHLGISKTPDVFQLQSRETPTRRLSRGYHTSAHAVPPSAPKCPRLTSDPRYPRMCNTHQQFFGPILGSKLVNLPGSGVGSPKGTGDPRKFLFWPKRVGDGGAMRLRGHASKKTKCQIPVWFCTLWQVVKHFSRLPFKKANGNTHAVGTIFERESENGRMRI